VVPEDKVTLGRLDTVTVGKDEIDTVPVTAGKVVMATDPCTSIGIGRLVTVTLPVTSGIESTFTTAGLDAVFRTCTPTVELVTFTLTGFAS
jgi:hypothetical protein